MQEEKNFTAGKCGTGVHLFSAPLIALYDGRSGGARQFYRLIIAAPVGYNDFQVRYITQVFKGRSDADGFIQCGDDD